MAGSELSGETPTDATLHLDPPCPICGASNAQILLKVQSPDNEGGHHPFAMVKCHGCGVGLTEPRPACGDLHRFYPTDYRPHKAKPVKSEDRVGWFSGCPERKRLTPFGQGRLLDFGCGGGSYLSRMRKQGWKAAGVDSNRETCERLSAEGFAAHHGTLPHPDLKAQSFDAITMWQSLEHVPDPVAVLQSAWDLLAPKGKLFVAVPTWDSWNFARYGQDWFGVDMPRHLIHFTPKSLSQVIDKAGFELLSLTRLNHPEWLRRSAKNRTAKQGSLLDSLLAAKWGARLGAWWVHWILNRADCLYARAQKR